MSALRCAVGAQGTLGKALTRAAGVPARVRTWFDSDATSAALAWLAAIALCAGVLAWFFVSSPYGAPAAPVYAEF